MARLWSRLRGWLVGEVKRRAGVWKYTRKVVRGLFSKHLQRCDGNRRSMVLKHWLDSFKLEREFCDSDSFGCIGFLRRNRRPRV
jgi:hypothetical protein